MLSDDFCSTTRPASTIASPGLRSSTDRTACPERHAAGVHFEEPSSVDCPQDEAPDALCHPSTRQAAEKARPLCCRIQVTCLGWLTKSAPHFGDQAPSTSIVTRAKALPTIPRPGPLSGRTAREEMPFRPTEPGALTGNPYPLGSAESSSRRPEFDSSKPTRPQQPTGIYDQKSSRFL